MLLARLSGTVNEARTHHSVCDVHDDCETNSRDIMSMLEPALNRFGNCLLTESHWDGQVFGHFTTGTCWHNICKECPEDVIPVALELAFDDYGQTRSTSVGPVYLRISSLPTKLKNDQRFIFTLAMKKKGTHIMCMLRGIADDLSRLVSVVVVDD